MNIIKKLSRKSLFVAISTGMSILVVAVAFVLISIRSDNNFVSADANQKQLRGQVETVTGAPRDGRDPASQPQTSLGDVASKPTGSGRQKTDSTTKKSDTSSQTNANSTNANQDGLGTNGCYTDYGIQGQECLPAHAATNGVLTCDGVNSHFPNGIKVTGTDRYHLDHNHNGIACDSSE